MANEDYKAALITAIRAGDADRERAFKFFEEKLADAFKGTDGGQFFNDLYTIVKEADPDAIDEYCKRFIPLLSKEAQGEVMLTAFSEGLHNLNEAKKRDLEEKEALVTFIDAIEKSSDADLGLLVESTIAHSTPQQLKAIVVFLVLALRKRKKP